MVSQDFFDVVVIGGGMGGLSAATAAAEAGARVLLAEKGVNAGGSAIYSAGMFFTARTMEEMIKQVPLTTVPLAAKLLEDYLPALKLIRDRGIRVSDVFLPTVTMGQAYPIDCKGLMIKEEALIAKLGGEVRKATAGVKLNMTSEGRIKGVTLKDMNSGETYEVATNAVILASGGFQGSADLTARYIGFGADNMLLRTNLGSVGDGLRMGTSAGAALSKGLSSFYGHLLPSPLRREDIDPHKFPFVSQYQSNYTILVNKEGKRFVDENQYDDDNNQAVLKQDGSKAWLLLDSDTHAKYCIAPPFPNAGDIDRVAIAKQYGGNVAITDTLEELVDVVAGWGPNKANLTKTLADFNAFVDGNVDVLPEIPITNPNAALKTAPFYAVQVQPSITFPYGGIKINTKAEALDSDGSPIPALYVAGVDAGGFSNGHYAGGLSVAFITGQWAGKNAAAWSKRQGVKMNGDV